MSIEYFLVVLVALAISFGLWRYLSSWFRKIKIFPDAVCQIENSLSYEWKFLDQILLEQEHHPAIIAFFNEAKVKSLEDKRRAMCILCVVAAAYKGRMQSALLTAEFASAYQALINSFPEDYYYYYSTTRSLKPVHVLHVRGGEIFEGSIDEMMASPEAQAFFNKISDWMDVPLPQKPSELRDRAISLTDGVDKRMAVFRFCKTVQSGKSRKNKKKKFAWKPLFDPLAT